MAYGGGNPFLEKIMMAGGGNPMAGLQQMGQQNQLATMLGQQEYQQQQQMNPLLMQEQQMRMEQLQRESQQKRPVGAPIQANDGSYIQGYQLPDGSTTYEPVMMGEQPLTGQTKQTDRQKLQDKIAMAMGVEDFKSLSPEQKKQGYRIVSGKGGEFDLWRRKKEYEAAQGKKDYKDINTNRQGQSTGVNPLTGRREVIPDSPEVTNIKEQEFQKFVGTQQANYDNVVGTIKSAIDDIDSQADEGFFSVDTAGGTAGKLSEWLPMADEGYALNKKIDTVKANVAFGALQAMREASKTGGALGSVSEKELNLLESSLQNLDSGLAPSIKRKNLETTLNHYHRLIESLGGQRADIKITADPRIKPTQPTQATDDELVNRYLK